MLWFNNHSSDQEHFYMEAREFMREQRRQQQVSQNNTDNDSSAALLAPVGACIATIVFITSLNIGLAFGVLILSIIISFAIDWYEDTKRSKTNNTKK